MINIFIIILTVLLFIEFLLGILVDFLRNFYDGSHNWIKNKYVTNIITKKKDYFPKINKEELAKFKVYMQDNELGSIYKKNTSVIEKYLKKNKVVRTRYSIQNNGARFNNLYKKKNNISTYGDSLAFCRYVNDDQTWQYHLSKYTKSNVKNYGVGNYGLDQSYLRFLKNKNEKSKLIIFAVGPETIRRNLSLWKHYYEFGNIYSFKPAYLLNANEKLIKVSLKMKNISLSTNLFNIHKKIKKLDFFYKEKFSKYIWCRPYIFSFLVNFKRKSILLAFFSLKYLEIQKKIKFINKTNTHFFKDMNLLGGLKYDFLDKLVYFKSRHYYQNSLNLIKKIKKDVSKQNKKVLLIIIPAHYDYVYRKKKENYYKNFIDDCNKHVDCLDLGSYLNKKEKDIFADEGFGGHFNGNGNKIISKIIYEYLKKKDYL